MRGVKHNNRSKSVLWRSPYNTNSKASYYSASIMQNTNTSTGFISNGNNDNAKLRQYEIEVKQSFDTIENNIKSLLKDKNVSVKGLIPNLESVIGSRYLSTQDLTDLDGVCDVMFRKLYAKAVFANFLQMSQDFFTKDPLDGQNKSEAEKMFRDAGFHSVGLATCADGRLAHLVSYVLRLPYSLVRRKAHAGVLFDVSESVRNWVFVEHNRYREALPNTVVENTKYLKIAAYHFSGSHKDTQGCAAHGSDDNKAASAALEKLKDFRKAIENRFSCGTTVQTILLGVNTDDDSLRVHIPNVEGNICLQRFVDTKELYQQTANNQEERVAIIENSIDEANTIKGSTKPDSGVKAIIAWLIQNNFSQIEYVNDYENGEYSDIGHAERFIGVGNSFEEVQLRNLSYYSFLDTIEEGAADIDVGLKIFKGLNITKGLPVPIIIRCDYDGRVPGSRDRAKAKARRINLAIHNRYEKLSKTYFLDTLLTLRDYTKYSPIETISANDESKQG
jgi:carboxysome shell carbonic anhydrase